MMKMPALPGIIVGASLIVPFGVNQPYVYHIGIMVCIMAMVAMAINIVLLIGQLSFAHVAFMAIGAYTSALLATRLAIQTDWAVLAGAAFTTIVAILIGPLVLRTRGVYFVLLTFAFSQVVNLILQEWTSVTGGNSGLYGIVPFGIAGKTIDTPAAFYAMAVASAVATLAAALAFTRGVLGDVVTSLRENDALGQALGVRVMLWRVVIFAFSAFVAGVAGGLYAHYIGFLSPAPFSFHVTMDAIVMNVVGGMFSPYGAMLGAIIIQPLPEVLREWQEYQLLIFAALLAVILLFLPNGILGWLGRTGRGKK